MTVHEHLPGETPPPEPIIEDYLRLGLALGRHIEGFVDAYYGPPALAARIAAEPPAPPPGWPNRPGACWLPWPLMERWSRAGERG